MSWLNSIGGLLQQYAAGGNVQNPAEVNQHFDQVSAAAPQDALGNALGNALNSGQGGGFANMVTQLFNNSSPEQRASLLNSLMGSVGPGLLASLANQHHPDLAGSLAGQSSSVSPQVASQVSPDFVQQLAQHAQNQNPGIVNEIGNFYSQHPRVVQSLGAATLALVMSHLSQQRG